jgi:hypothetical protein
MKVVVVKMGSIFKKQHIDLPSGLAVAQARVLFFICDWDVSDCF